MLGGDANPKTKPWMPPVQQFAKLSSVGVLKPRCIMRRVHIRDAGALAKPR